MKIREIKHNKRERPVSVTVTLTLDEAAFITTVLGSQSGDKSNSFMPRGDAVGTEIYSCLTGGLFNRYWNDGIDGYLREDKE